MWVLRAAVFLSITGVIQHSQQTFLFCDDGYTDPDIWMYQVLPRWVAHINNSLYISSVTKFMIWLCTPRNHAVISFVLRSWRNIDLLWFNKVIILSWQIADINNSVIIITLACMSSAVWQFWLSVVKFMIWLCTPPNYAESWKICW